MVLPCETQASAALWKFEARSECKANWGNSNSVVHANEISNPRPQEWDPCRVLHSLHPHPSLCNWPLQRQFRVEKALCLIRLKGWKQQLLVLEVLCFLPGSDGEQRGKRCTLHWTLGYCSCVYFTQGWAGVKDDARSCNLNVIWIIWWETQHNDCVVSGLEPLPVFSVSPQWQDSPNTYKYFTHICCNATCPFALKRIYYILC